MNVRMSHGHAHLEERAWSHLIQDSGAVLKKWEGRGEELLRTTEGRFSRSSEESIFLFLNGFFGNKFRKSANSFKVSYTGIL